jgi:hypothetical protein
MPGYVDAALHKFQHPNPASSQDSPHPAPTIQYSGQQMTAPVRNLPKLNKPNTKYMEQVVGTFL